MQIEVPEARQDATVDGGPTGYLSVSNNVTFFVGCEAFLCRSNLQKRCIITELVGTTQVGLRFQADDNEQQFPSYGNRSDLTGWTVALGTRLNMPKQLARIEKAWSRPLDTV